jgi:hypothetical protein
MKTNDKTKSEAVSLSLRVAVSTGVTNEHIYSLPEKRKEAFKIIDSLVDSITDVLGAKTGFLHLENPSITYNPKHIVYIKEVFRGPAEWEELMRRSTKRPLGFIPEKASE